MDLTSGIMSLQLLEGPKEQTVGSAARNDYQNNKTNCPTRKTATSATVRKLGHQKVSLLPYQRDSMVEQLPVNQEVMV